MAQVLAFNPNSARSYLHGLHGAAHRYAWRYYRFLLGKSRTVPAEPGRRLRRVAGIIRQAIQIGMGLADGPRVAPATFVGWQKRPGGKPSVALYNLTAAIPGHPKGSTVSAPTLTAAGFALPETPPEDNGLIWGARRRNPGGKLIVNGVLYDIVATTQDREGELLMIRRPKGVKEYLARRLPDSPLYGESRGVIIHALPRSRNPRAGRFRHERLASPRRFDPRSFRTVRSGRARVVVGCPKGHYHRGRCRVGTRAQAILRPANPRDVSAGAWRRLMDLTTRLHSGGDREAARYAAQYADHLIHGGAAPEFYVPGWGTERRERLDREVERLLGVRKSNPPRGRAVGGARLIYPSGRIVGMWEGRHKNGKLYRHKFGRGLKSIYGLPGGDLLLTAHQGRLWKTFS